ncbi:type I restriction enzyme HsdR N-terminal domain-containing protein [Candidatus Protochlamydia sp. W-9]|uniref:type I restriction enzyme HsdR N-terminal domain-containing protein n=1 Tax=Candidatus Protochlamydia sp. W-9 TaxID=1785087 RepID=UPI00096AC8B8|nr:type I restriction enzyme HsdR N-terminal domain-containing protein [Candidatus Protochlamydia sp. W-9]
MPNQLFCSVRKKWILETPEEKVRQLLISHMTQNLGYPIGSLALEVTLSQMPHLRHIPPQQIPKRRADLVILTPHLHPSFPLYPLLLIECKAVPLTDKAMRQVIGYNQFLQACFIGLANQDEKRLGWYDPQQKDYQAITNIFSYPSLLQQAKLSLIDPRHNKLIFDHSELIK